MNYTLTLDLGGTNPRIAIISEENEILCIEKIDPQTDLITQINEYLKKRGEEQITTDSCCIAIAGVVYDHRESKTTNNSISVDAQEIRNNTLLKHILVVNDFEAIGYYVANIQQIGNSTIQNIIVKKEENNSDKPKVIIGPGTGLGVCFITDTNIQPSQAGHSSIPLVYPEFISWLERKLNVENICSEIILSGRGIELLYEWKTGLVLTAEKITISKDPLAKVCMHMFMSYLGAFARNMALTNLSLGGVYLAGGILPKNTHFLTTGQLEKHFIDSYHDDVRNFLRRVPIYLITDYNCSLLGCKFAIDSMKNLNRH